MNTCKRASSLKTLAPRNDRKNEHIPVEIKKDLSKYPKNDRKKRTHTRITIGLRKLMNIKKLFQPFFIPILKRKTDSPQKNLKKALQISNTKKQQAVFVFDIDSTLLCMKYRTQAIIDEALQKDFLLKEFSQDSKKLSQVKVTETDWSVVDILSRYGIKDQKLLKKIESHWKKLFFSDKYLHLDQPYEGAVDFLNKLASQNSIYYLTARNNDILRQGTLKSLKKWGFPLQEDCHLIMMKQSLKESDKEYKSKHLKILSKQFESVCFFENEPVILNQVNKILPHVHLFWMNSTHSRKETPPRKALTLSMDYSLD